MATDYIKWMYPNQVYIVEVKYSGDIAIAHCRCKEYPPEKENRYGFTENYNSYQAAMDAAVNISRQLHIPFPGGYQLPEVSERSTTASLPARKTVNFLRELMIIIIILETKRFL